MYLSKNTVDIEFISGYFKTLGLLFNAWLIYLCNCKAKAHSDIYLNILLIFYEKFYLELET
jgi:hypothetical protein